MILCQRDILDEDLEVKMDWLENSAEVQIIITNKSDHTIEWCKSVVGDGKLALEVFYHPYFYGFGLDN